ncbi:hypothetical protein KIPB_000853 [Kipferlia bialata]|uniref:SAM domain-containing protein n=1 Tax=Kipferlia bialata TaxID=797122 RepID=A0A9K3CPU6_9EUKA|nr:hypothetical protein KIPB_000853 [Kipferlia bialata]|eukprot:g853.t1
MGVYDWLVSAGLEAFYPNFEVQKISEEEFIAITIQDYASLGVTKLSDKQKLFRLVSALKEEMKQPSESRPVIPREVEVSPVKPREREREAPVPEHRERERERESYREEPEPRNSRIPSSIPSRPAKVDPRGIPTDHGTVVPPPDQFEDQMGHRIRIVISTYMSETARKRPTREGEGGERERDERPPKRRQEGGGAPTESTLVPSSVNVDPTVQVNQGQPRSTQVKQEVLPYLSERVDLATGVRVKEEGEGEGRDREGVLETQVKVEGFPPLKERDDLPLLVPVKEEGEGGDDGVPMAEKAVAHRDSVNDLATWIYTQEDSGRLRECGALMGQMAQDLYTAGRREISQRERIQTLEQRMDALTPVIDATRLTETDREGETAVSCDAERQGGRERDIDIADGPQGQETDGNQSMAGREGEREKVDAEESETNRRLRVDPTVLTLLCNFLEECQSKHCWFRQLFYTTKPTKISLVHQTFGAGSARDLTALFNLLPSLRHFDLDVTGLGDAGTLHVIRGLPKLKNIMAFGVSGRLGPDGAQALADVIPSVTFLEQLCLTDCYIGDTGAEALAGALSQKPFREFALVDESVTDAGAAAIAGALSGATSLRKLSLCLDSLTGVGALALAESFASLPFLTKLHLTFELGDREVSALGKSLNSLRSLTELYIDMCDFGPAGAMSLAKGLKVTKRLEKIHLCGDMRPEGAIAVLVSVSDARSLEELMIVDCTVRDDAAQLIGKGLACWPRLKKLCLKGVKDCEDKGIGDAGARDIASRLWLVPLLTELILDHNCIGNPGVQAIIEARRDVPLLEKLCLGSNNIGDEGGEAIRKSLATMNALRELPLDGNPMSLDIQERIDNTMSRRTRKRRRADQHAQSAQDKAKGDIWRSYCVD